jgi:sodium-dependent dicarboxylate transporter 2/3/5
LVLVVSGILPAREALASFADPIIWIFIAGFILAASFRQSGLDKRLAYMIAMLYKGRDPRIAILFIASLPVLLLSMTGSITASTSIVFPFVLAFLKTMNDGSFLRGDEKHYSEASLLVLGQAATAGAMLLIISTAPNLVAKATIEKFVPGETLSFVDWLIIGTPHAITGLFVSWLVVFALLRPNFKIAPAVHDKLKKNLRELGVMTRSEKIILVLLSSALFLWVVPSLLRSADFSPNMNSFIVSALRNVSEPIPAIFLIVSLAIIRPGRRAPPLLGWTEMAKSIDWNVVLLFGGGLVLGLGIQASGLASLIGMNMANTIGLPASPWIIFCTSAVMGFLVSYVASNTASAVITCPIAAALAIGSGVNPIPPIIAAALACSISSAIPSTTPPMAIVYSSKLIRISNMFKTGIISDLVRLAILMAIGPILTGLIFV